MDNEENVKRRAPRQGKRKSGEARNVEEIDKEGGSAAWEPAIDAHSGRVHPKLKPLAAFLPQPVQLVDTHDNVNPPGKKRKQTRAPSKKAGRKRTPSQPEPQQRVEARPDTVEPAALVDQPPQGAHEGQVLPTLQRRAPPIRTPSSAQEIRSRLLERFTDLTNLGVGISQSLSVALPPSNLPSCSICPTPFVSTAIVSSVDATEVLSPTGSGGHAPLPPTPFAASRPPMSPTTCTGTESTNAIKEKLSNFLQSLSPAEATKILQDATKDRNFEAQKTTVVREASASKKKKKTFASKEKARQEAEELATRRHIDELDRRIQELQAEKLRSTGFYKKTTFPSPRESSKGVPSNNKVDLQDPSMLKLVNTGKKGSGRRVLSIDSCTVPARSGSITCSDVLSLGTWESVKNIPPVELNEQLQPVGLYWEHLSQFAFERAKMMFEWHIEWRQQDDTMKSHFKYRLRQLYPGNWEEKYVMAQIGNNLKERRIRLRKRFEKCNNKNSISVPVGCTLEAWNAIYDSLSDPKYQEKADKCRSAADERTSRIRFTHKLGPGGVKKLILKFVDEFSRPPTNEEITYAKRNGVPALIEHIYAKKKATGKTLVQELVEVVDSPVKRCSKKQSSTKKKPNEKESVKPLESESEGSAATSSDDEEDEDGTPAGSGSSGDRSEDEHEFDEHSDEDVHHQVHLSSNSDQS